DSTGAVIAGAQIKLTREDQSHAQEIASGADGQFSFTNVAPGAFVLTITSNGFAAQTFSGTLQAGETQHIPPIMLIVATADTSVQALSSPVEIAEQQIKVEEQQRVLKVIPNFYVSYIHDAEPLVPRQKFELAWKTMADPFSFIAVGLISGVQQAQ